MILFKRPIATQKVKVIIHTPKKKRPQEIYLDGFDKYVTKQLINEFSVL